MTRRQTGRTYPCCTTADTHPNHDCHTALAVCPSCGFDSDIVETESLPCPVECSECDTRFLAGKPDEPVLGCRALERDAWCSWCLAEFDAERVSIHDPRSDQHKRDVLRVWCELNGLDLADVEREIDRAPRRLPQAAEDAQAGGVAAVPLLGASARRPGRREETRPVRRRYDRSVRGWSVKYRTIVADPPWEYPEGFALGPGHGTLEVRPLPYPSMTLDEIKALDVAALANADCRLFVWTTNRYLRAAFDVLDAWGFRYRQTLVWHKVDANLPAHIAPNSAEYILVAVRGKPERLTTLPSSVIAIARSGGHSAKPEAWLDYIEAASPGPYLEMFSRRARLGWDTWGNEALGGTDLLAA